jgi:hypothetical protein
MVSPEREPQRDLVRAWLASRDVHDLARVTAEYQAPSRVDKHISTIMKSHLTLHQNLDDFEAFYSMLDDTHASLDRSQSAIVNSQLVLLLSNHIGDMAVLREAFALARVKLEMIRPDQEKTVYRPGK